MSGSLERRLTFAYAITCILSLIATMGLSYLVLRSSLESEIDEELLNEIEEYRALLSTQDLSVLQDVLTREAISEGTDHLFFRVLDSDAKEVVATDLSGWTGIDVHRPSVLAAAAGHVVFANDDAAVRQFAARVAYGGIGPDLILQLGTTTADSAKILYRLREVVALGTVVLASFSILVGRLMARRALGGVHRVTQTAKAISAGAWESRVPLSSRSDEIDQLAGAFNEMVERVQVLIRELKDVADDIAHDLRTPITRIRAAAETALLRPDGNASPSEINGSILEDCDRLLDLINTMLEISQIESGVRPLACSEVDLVPLAEEICEFFRPAAEDNYVELSFAASQPLYVHADAQRLKRAIAHLVDNAVKYTDSGGRIAVRCSMSEGFAKITVQDNGVGIPASELERIFARFYRGEESRTAIGNGLGLSLARAICRAHGGDITVTSTEGRGSIFTIAIPAESKRNEKR